METAVVTALKAHAGLTALISGRVYPVIIPQNKALPALAYMKVSNYDMETMDCSDSSTTHSRLQIDVIAVKYSEVKAVAKQVRLAMQSSTEFQAVKITDRDLASDNPDVFRVLLEFNVWFKEV